MTRWVNTRPALSVFADVVPGARDGAVLAYSQTLSRWFPYNPVGRQRSVWVPVSAMVHTDAAYVPITSEALMFAGYIRWPSNTRFVFTVPVPDSFSAGEPVTFNVYFRSDGAGTVMNVNIRYQWNTETGALLPVVQLVPDLFAQDTVATVSLPITRPSGASFLSIDMVQMGVTYCALCAFQLVYLVDVP